MTKGPELTFRQETVLVSLRSAVKTAPAPLRSCGECAKCCEGWLSGSVYGHPFYPGCPCFYLEKTCSIYKDRPDTPCRSYRCGWLSEDIFPMWMKPSLVNIIITKEPDKDYWVINQAGDRFDQRALDWLVKWAKSTSSNIEYRVNGEVKRTGSPEFVNG